MSLPPNATVETISVRRLAIDIVTPYAQAVERFRSLVPPIKLGDLRNATSPDQIEAVVRDTATTTGFVLFNEFNHGHWISHFPPFTTAPEAAGVGHGAHRFIFGNPLFAITMIRESIEAAMHVPLDCGFFEQNDGSAKMVILLPDGLVAGHAGAAENEALHVAARALEAKVFKLIEAITNS
ncbi:hypothetical protein N7448_004100 [Penicillium atrosanguineum]|uniref:Uncharacterized protein n=1 Tax=Penicillium atrosanguineum TaxID=1132637 RepID=A0A9W9PXP9_9EURO|nr:uncharacterized protein N7443_003064 [Penicillium atrosanguineum]KAJ5117155.1 hypothetical protein N7526_011264 [Penicillium atrosanguineum]KAJ5140692.1 hypothetical protein N7448_004100 [Penicillium atrosanguineum]KAJ5310603.1 hypothetical protein N7443_003064 [Penicillium atrosanguineum]KAJ5316125.1 hypothetical protein N7476_006432 [Penicillium atrosanguineum]